MKEKKELQPEDRPLAQPADFVPDFYKCNNCNNVGAEEFAYDPNPKNLPPIEAPMIYIELDFAVGDFGGVGEHRTTMRPLTDEERRENRRAGKAADFTTGAEYRARHTGNPPSFVMTDEKEIVGIASELPPSKNFVPIADIFGCARTGEEGAVYCASCKSYNVQLLSTAEQNKMMVDACLADINAEEWDGGGAIYASPIGSEREFVEGLQTRGEEKGYDRFTTEEVVRLYKNYQKA